MTKTFLPFDKQYGHLIAGTWKVESVTGLLTIIDSIASLRTHRQNVTHRMGDDTGSDAATCRACIAHVDEVACTRERHGGTMSVCVKS